MRKKREQERKVMDNYQNSDQNRYQNGYQTNDWGQQGYYQNNQQNYYQNGNGFYQDSRKQNLEEPMSIGEWLLTMLITAIPCVNIIMICVWAFGSGTKRTKANWARATLIVFLISVVIGVLLSVFGANQIANLYYQF